MRITLVMVTSLDGKTTHATNTHRWASSEDQEHFRKLKTEYPVIIMGRKTYESAKSHIQLSTRPVRYVMTKHPKTFINERVPGQLEFTDDSPKQLIDRLIRLGHDSALLVGGSNLNDAFLQDKLITDCYITIEPKFFGSGNSIFTLHGQDIPLKLISMKKLNKQGTLLLHYSIES